MEPNQDAPEVLETPEVVEETTPETPKEPKLTAEEIEALKAKAAKADELEEKNKQLFERIKKAKQAPSDDGLSSKDVLYLAKADIHADDVDEVLTYAKKMGVTVAEAHKFFKPIPSERDEERKTAQASHTKGGARGTSKVSGEDLLRKAEQTGEVPTDDAGMSAIFEARQKRRLQ